MTQLPLGLYERLNFFVSPVPLAGQLALAIETLLLARQGFGANVKNEVWTTKLNGAVKSKDMSLEQQI